MGYEVKLFVVEKSPTCFNENFSYWGQEIATYELCVCNQVSDFMDKKNPTDCYVYADDGNTQIVEDYYGDPLHECEISEFYEFLTTVEDDYRRIAPLKALIKSFVENKNRFSNLYVLSFGH